MTNLFEIVGQYKGLMLIADELPEDALRDTLEAITDDLDTKGRHIAHVIKNFDTTAIDNEIKRLQAMKKTITNRKQHLKDYLRDGMTLGGISKIEWDTGGITLTKARPVAVIFKAENLPPEYVKTTITTAPIKADILKALKAGTTVPGASLGESKQGILIK
jgi:hypothetical protein